MCSFWYPKGFQSYGNGLVLETNFLQKFDSLLLIFEQGYNLKQMCPGLWCNKSAPNAHSTYHNPPHPQTAIRYTILHLD